MKKLQFSSRIRAPRDRVRDAKLAVIAENRRPEFLSIHHLGEIRNGVVDTDSESVRAWAPAPETCTLADLAGETEVRVDLDTTPEFEESMLDKWPKALARLKSLCEAGSGLDA